MVLVKVMRNTKDDSGYIFRLCRYIVNKEHFVYSYGYGVDYNDPATVYEQMMRVRHYYGKTSGNSLIHYLVSFDESVQDLKTAIQKSHEIAWFLRTNIRYSSEFMPNTANIQTIMFIYW